MDLGQLIWLTTAGVENRWAISGRHIFITSDASARVQSTGLVVWSAVENATRQRTAGSAVKKSLPVVYGWRGKKVRKEKKWALKKCWQRVMLCSHSTVPPLTADN